MPSNRGLTGCSRKQVVGFRRQILSLLSLWRRGQTGRRSAKKFNRSLGIPLPAFQLKPCAKRVFAYGVQSGRDRPVSLDRETNLTLQIRQLNQMELAFELMFHATTFGTSRWVKQCGIEQVSHTLFWIRYVTGDIANVTRLIVEAENNRRKCATSCP